jgi:hypothetical protein
VLNASHELERVRGLVRREVVLTTGRTAATMATQLART